MLDRVQLWANLPSKAKDYRDLTVASPHTNHHKSGY